MGKQSEIFFFVLFSETNKQNLSLSSDSLNKFHWQYIIPTRGLPKLEKVKKKHQPGCNRVYTAYCLTP